MLRPKGAYPPKISAPASTAPRENRMAHSAPRTSAGARSTTRPVRVISSRSRAAFTFNAVFAAMDDLLLCIWLWRQYNQ